MTEPSTFARCESCGAVEWGHWPMTHRRNCPAALPEHDTDTHPEQE